MDTDSERVTDADTEKLRKSRKNETVRKGERVSRCGCLGESERREGLRGRASREGGREGGLQWAASWREKREGCAGP